MKLSAYRESLLGLTEQVLADYELQVLLQPTSTKSPYFGQDLKGFAERVFSSINSPQILTASSIGGTPIPGLTDLDTLPGKNQFNGDKMAPNLKARSAVPFHPKHTANASPDAAPAAPPPTGGNSDFKLPSGANTKDLSREQLLEMLKLAVSAGGGGGSQTRV